RGPAPLLRLQSDERLVALVRRGHQSAFETIVSRYQARLLAFCRHMLASREDAEDVLQEVFAAAFNAMIADNREINVRPWLYRIARNRSLNHLRRATAIGVDSMDVHLAEGGQSTSDKVFKREAFRQLMHDVQLLPESQRTALLLREMDALSYQEIAEAMETTVPSVKSLLVRARVSLGEAAEARRMSCEEVRLELGQVAEGLARTSAPVRRHVRECERCATFRSALKANNRALAAVLPVAPLLLAKKLLLAKLGTSASAGGASAAGAGGAAAGTAVGTGSGLTAGGALSAGLGALSTKAAAGLAAAALVTAAGVEVRQHNGISHHHAAPSAETAQVRVPVRSTTDPVVVASRPQPDRVASKPRGAVAKDKAHQPAVKPAVVPPAKAPLAAVKTPATVKPTAATPNSGATVQLGSDTTALPTQPRPSGNPSSPSSSASEPSGAPTGAGPTGPGPAPAGTSGSSSSSGPSSASSATGAGPSASSTPTATGGSAQPPS
ncbi:MAG TPA: RNA polymerase sigma factor, partial [Solirubrobacteraceae bacterium]|nr:RNA polymerase sigma factor [Solirubrobacteraceae bacterium]